MNAMHEFLDPLKIAEELAKQSDALLPETLVGDKAATLNGTGYIFYKISPLAQEFLDHEASPGKNLLEIGAGFGNVSIAALRKGVATYTANDMAQEHLKILVHKMVKEFHSHAQDKLQRLKLLLAQAPKQLPIANQLYDAVLVDKVLHFMSPKEIEQFIQWLKKAVKKNGKIYILTISPYNPVFSDKVLPFYLSNQVKDELYPGYILDSQPTIDSDKLHNYPNFHIPKQMIFFDIKALQHLFESHGFTVNKTFSLKVPEEDGPWQEVTPDMSGLVGIIAVNS